MIYFDQAATSYPKLEVVKKAVNDALDIAGNANRSMNHDASRLIFQTRKLIKHFFNCDQVVFNSGNTESLNTCIMGMLQPDDHVITNYSSHNSVLRPLYHYLDDISIVDGGVTSIEQAIKPNTKMILINHCSNITGEICDLFTIGKLAKMNDVLFVVDSGQSAGHIEIDMKEDNIDVLTFSGHKSLLGISGIGGICFQNQVRIRPLKYGGTGIDSFSKNMKIAYPERLEAGTANIVGIASLNAGIKYLTANWQIIKQQENKLCQHTYTALKQIAGLNIYNSTCPQVPIFVIKFEQMDAAMLADKLFQEYQIITRCGAHCAPLMMEHLKSESLVRISLSFQNTLDEIEQLINALTKIGEEIK